MKNIDEIYNESMNEIENYDVDATFDRIVELANKGVSRKIEEFDIEFENIAKNSVGKDKQRKKTGVLKKVLALVLLITMVSALVGCGKKTVDVDNEVATNPYEEILNKMQHEFYAEAHGKGRKIGSAMVQEINESYGNGTIKSFSSEDIVLSVANVISGDNWYEFFDVNLSMMPIDEINNQKYEIALTVYQGIMEELGSLGNFSEDLDTFMENIVGKGIVLEYCEHFDKLIYNNVGRELTEEEKLNNIELLARYYRTKAVEDKEATLTLS